MTSSRPGSAFGSLRGGEPGRDLSRDLSRDPSRDPSRERTAYTRFIPREELEGASVWMPGSLGESFDTGSPAAAAPAMPWQPLDSRAPARPMSPLQAAARAAGVVLHPEAAPAAQGTKAPPHHATPPRSTGPAGAATPAPAASSATGPGEPDLVIEPAPPAASPADAAQAAAALAELQAGWEARLEAEVAAARQAGYQDGYRDGLEALDSFKSSYAQQVTAQVGQVLQSLDGELRQLEQDAAASLARVAIALARQVVRSELQTHPDLVAQVAQEAVNAVMTGARQLTVKVHPDDHGLVAEGCAEALSARGARLVAEPTLERGGCVVETEAGGVDARVATRWAAVMQTMGSAEPWQAGGAAGDLS